MNVAICLFLSNDVFYVNVCVIAVVFFSSDAVLVCEFARNANMASALSFLCSTLNNLFDS